MWRAISKLILMSVLMLSMSVLYAQDDGQAGAETSTSTDTAASETAASDNQPAAPAPPAGQQVYRSVDKDGRIIFTDKPPADRPSDAILVKPTNTVSMSVSNSDDYVDQKNTKVMKYDSLVIISPSNDQFFGQDVDSVTLHAKLKPRLRDGDKAQLYYDGKPVGDDELFFTVSNLERGTHTVEAKVFDQSNAVLIEAAPVQFHVRRTSVLNKPRNNDSDSDNDAPPQAGFGSFGGVGGTTGAGGATGAGGVTGAAGVGGFKPPAQGQR